jgi:hypothetical protein
MWPLGYLSKWQIYSRQGLGAIRTCRKGVRQRTDSTFNPGMGAVGVMRWGRTSQAWFPLEWASRGGASMLLMVTTSSFSIAPAQVKSVPYFQSYIPCSCTFPLTLICTRLCPLPCDHYCPIHSSSLFPLCYKINTSTTPLSHPIYLSFNTDSSYSLCFNFSSVYFHRSHSQVLLV